MLEHRRRIGLALVMAPLLVSASPSAQAPLVCTISGSRECGSDLECLAGRAREGLTPPSFIHVDVDAQRITLLAPPERRGEETSIRAVDREGDRLILSGVEASRGWSMIISEPEGRMTLAVSDDAAVLAVFGRCIGADRVTP